MWARVLEKWAQYKTSSIALTNKNRKIHNENTKQHRQHSKQHQQIQQTLKKKMLIIGTNQTLQTSTIVLTG